MNGKTDHCRRSCTASGRITLRIQVGKFYYTTPKVGLSESFLIAMILGRDWQAVPEHATIIIEPNGAIRINTPSTSQEFDRSKSSKSDIGYEIQSRYTNKSVKKCSWKMLEPIGNAITHQLKKIKTLCGE